MAKQLLDEYVDRKAIKSDTEFFITEAKKVSAALQELKGSGLSVESTKSFKSIADGLRDVQKAQEALNKTLLQGDKLSRDQIKTATEFARQKAAAAKATEAETRAEQAKLKVQGETVRNQKLLAQYQTQLTKEQEKLAKQQEKANRELDKANNAYTQLSKSYSVAANASKRRGAELLIEAQGNSKLYTELLKTDKAYITATQDAMKYYQQLDLLENTVGQAQRRVGQYERAQFSLNQVLREAPAFAYSLQTGFMAISNNLPMLVDEFKKLREATGSNFSALKVLIGGLFSFQTALLVAITAATVYGKEIGQFFKGLTKGTEAITQAKLATETFNKALSDTSVRDAVKNVSELATNVQLAKDGFLNKNDVIKQYNESMGKTTGIVKTLDEVEQALVKNGPAYIQMMLFKAAANLALEEASKKALEAELNRQKKNDEFSSVFDDAAGSTASIPDAPGDLQEEIDKRASLNRARRKKKAVDDAQEEANFYTKIAEGFQKEAAKISKDFNFKFFGDEFDDKPKKEKKDKRKEEFKKFLEEARYDYLKTIQDLIALGDEFDKQIAKQNEDRINALFKSLSDAFTKSVKQLEKARDEDLASVGRAFTRGEIGIGEYKRYEQELQEAYNKKILEAEIKFYEDYIIALKNEGFDVAEAEAKLYEARLKLQEAFNKKRELLYKSDNEKAKEAGKEAAKEEKKTLKTIEELRKEFFTELQNALKAVVSGGFERRKNELQEQIDKNEELKAAEINRINASGDTEERKAARIQIIEAKTAAQREQLEQRQRRLDEQRARFERLFSIVRITQNTYVEASKYLGNPLAVGLIIAAGLAQAAAIIAVPPPKYRFGTDYHPGGDAIVGDGYVPEVATLPDGTSFITPDVPTMMYLPEGTKVSPSIDDYLSKMSVPLPYIRERTATSTDDGSRMMMKGFGMLADAIHNKKELHISGTHAGVSAIINNGNNWIKYINDQTNF